MAKLPKQTKIEGAVASEYGNIAEMCQVWIGQFFM